MNIIERYHKDILYYQIDGFNCDEVMNHNFSTRIGWNQNNLFQDLSNIFSIPKDKIYSARQVHGTDVKVIHENNLGTDIGEKDGLVTNAKGIALSTYHADCVPLYFYDSEKSVIGMAHAGWKGTLHNINKNMIEEMVSNFNCKVQDIRVGIGPSIGPCCYEVGSDVEKLFREKYSSYKEIIIKRDGKTYLNLWKVNYINLMKLGVEEENIYSSDMCTSCNVDKLYSYRKEKGTKSRMIASIILNS